MENEDYYEKYDRQIRLWGLDGQRRFAHSNICLINANALGSEIIKGLCLTGLNSITIFDTHRVTQEDVESSFLLPPDSISRNRAEVMVETIKEFGDNIGAKVGSFEDHLPHSDLNESQDEKRSFKYWEQFNAVIVCGNLYLDQMSTLSATCWDLNVPLIVTHCIGFFGYMQIQVKNHAILSEKSISGSTDDKKELQSSTFSTEPFSGDWKIFKEKKIKIIEDEEEAEFVNLFLGFKAIESYFSTYGRDLDYQENELETNFLKLKECAKKICQVPNKSFDQCLYEFCRVSEIELLATCAFFGGCVAQEAIKLITNLYHPVDNILVYNAVIASTKSFKSSEYLI